MVESRLKLNNIDSGDRNTSSSALIAQIIKWSGGIVSLILILGVVFWAYQLGKRDANQVPVIQSMSGIARERPEDPQGAQADHQGLDVNQVLASDETADIGAQTQLAPPPQRATNEDQPLSDQAVETLSVVAVIDETLPVETPAVDAAELTQAVVLNGDPNMTRPVRRVVQAGLSPNSELLSNAIADAIAEANATPEAVPAIATVDTITSAVPVGTQMIQLGVFDDEQSALRNWDSLIGNQSDLLTGLERYIERREAGGRVFYRLRAIGFADSIAASDLCAVLMGRDIQCIPVAAR